MIRILVDSASDILKDNKDNIIVVPLSVDINNHIYQDGVDLDRATFYELLTTTEEFPKTSQPSPQLFVEEFEKIKEAGDEVICIMLSSQISGTYQSAVLAKNMVDYDRIHIIDSLTAVYGQNLLVIEAQRGIEEGLSAAEIVKKVENLRKRIQIFLSVDTLEYLYKGGRLSKASAVVGGLAKVKPIIELNREGKLNVIMKTVGASRAMRSIIEMVQEKQIDSNYPFFTIHTSGTKNVEKLENKLAENGIHSDERSQLGAVIGSHVGPEVFGVIFVTKEQPQNI